MTQLLGTMIRPYYAQVALFDPTVDGSYPDWGTGEQEVVSGESGVAVETRPDNHGLVALEVWIDELPANHLRQILETSLRVAGPMALRSDRWQAMTSTAFHSSQAPTTSEFSSTARGARSTESYLRC